MCQGRKATTTKYEIDFTQSETHIANCDKNLSHNFFFLPASNSGVHSNKSISRVRSKIMSPYRSLNRIVPELKQGLRKVLSGCLKQVGFPIVHYIPVTL